MSNKKATSRTRNPRMTTVMKELQAINNIITKNKKLFKTGATISRADFVSLFNINDVTTGTYPVLQRANLVLVGVQNKVNRLMRENGLYLKSANYYSEFVVVKRESNKNKIINHSRKVDVFNNATKRLESNMVQRVNAGTWGTYNKVSNATIRTIGVQNSPRHNSTIQRVKTI